MKIWFILLIPIALSSCATSAEKILDTDPERLYFKNWTLSRCLGEITTNTPLNQDALNTASAYLEKSNLPIEAFSSADELVKKFLSRNYSGSIPGSFNIQKCIDLFHSEELEKLYQSLTNEL
jgi:hypothetical protein